MKIHLPEGREKAALLVPAAGRGLRMGGEVAKQYMILGDKPLLVHTLQNFISLDCFQQIVILVAPGEEKTCRGILQQYFPRQVFCICPGGSERQETVASGLLQLENEINLVCVHDAVRPFADPTLIARVLVGAARFGAATAAVAVKDTIKVTTPHGFVDKTLARDKLKAVQTPQAFQRELLSKAHQKAREAGLFATDDASLVEQLQYPVKLVEGSYANLKVTTPEDLVVAQALFERYNSGENEE